MIAPARTAAFQCLMAVTAGTDLASAIEQSRQTLADSRDRALATEIVTGVQRWRALLDHAISTLARRAVTRLDAEVLEILRLSAYQLLYLTRVPAAAVVDDAVNMAGRAGKKSARGFVNAVLRSLSRERAHLPLPPRPADPNDREAALAYCTITLSHPQWLVERWLDRYGFEATERWLHFNNTPPCLCIRANRLRTTVAQLEADLDVGGVRAVRGLYAPDCLQIPRGDREQPDQLEQLQDRFLVQDEASQLVTLLAGPRPGRLVLDTCASPGGKTTALAAAMQEDDPLGTDPPRGDDGRSRGMLVACDIRGRRIQVLRHTLLRAGTTNVRIVQADLGQPLPFAADFDCVFVDAPCSGLGTLRRDPDIKWRRQAADLRVLAAHQRTMLAHAAAVMTPTGRIIYATCSSEPEENDEVVRAVAAALDLVIVDARSAHPALPPAVVDADGALRTLPHRHQLEAFYGVVLQRRRQL